RPRRRQDRRLRPHCHGWGSSRRTSGVDRLRLAAGVGIRIDGRRRERLISMAPQHIPAGLAAIEREMARQHADALASFDGAEAVAKKIAASIRSSGRLVLLGMGGSHAVNRIAECVYRRLGIAAVSLPISEQLYSPLNLSDVPTLITSQSGESIEVHRLLD